MVLRHRFLAYRLDQSVVSVLLKLIFEIILYECIKINVIFEVRTVSRVYSVQFAGQPGIALPPDLADDVEQKRGPSGAAGWL